MMLCKPLKKQKRTLTNSPVSYLNRIIEFLRIPLFRKVGAGIQTSLDAIRRKVFKKVTKARDSVELDSVMDGMKCSCEVTRDYLSVKINYSMSFNSPGYNRLLEQLRRSSK